MGKGQIFRIISSIMIAIIVVILVVLFVSDDDMSSSVDIDMSVPYSDTANWMEYLPDDVYLSEITLPGTHDSCTRNVTLGYAMRCQDTTITEQLNDGYRYLDLRLDIDDKDSSKLKLVHNFVNCHESGSIFSDYLYFDGVCADIYSFLQQHPDETVIVNLKVENDDTSISAVQDLVLAELQANSDYWYTDGAIPTLGEVRGRAVLATRYKDEGATGITGLNLKWAQQNKSVPADIPYELYVNDDFRYWVQDQYKYSVEDKYGAVVDGLENCEADASTFFINFVSTSGDGKIGHPRGYANTLNDLLLNYDLREGTSYGIIVVDFGTADLARHIYYTNSF